MVYHADGIHDDFHGIEPDRRRFKKNGVYRISGKKKFRMADLTPQIRNHKSVGRNQNLGTHQCTPAESSSEAGMSDTP